MKASVNGSHLYAYLDAGRGEAGKLTYDSLEAEILAEDTLRTTGRRLRLCFDRESPHSGLEFEVGIVIGTLSERDYLVLVDTGRVIFRDGSYSLQLESTSTDGLLE